MTILATIAEVINIRGGMADVRYISGMTGGSLTVVAEGWDDYGPNKWPPQVNDKIEIIPVSPAVFCRGREATKGN